MRARLAASLAALTAVLTVAHMATKEPVRALSPDSAPALPAPSGTVVNVSSVSALQAAVASVSSNTTIVIAPGTYQLTSTLWVNGSKANVTIRGATNNRNDVVLVGQGMGVPSANVPFGIWAGGNVSNLTIANLTIRSIYQHPIMLNAGTQAPRIYNVRLVDAGEQFIKANPDGSGGGIDNGIVEYSVLEYTNAAPTDYTNGVDVHTGENWIIRHNLFRRIRAPQGQLAGPAVLVWNGSRNTVVEGNTFIDCDRDISLGLIQRTPDDHVGGIIRNNFIVRTTGSGGDVPIAVFDSPGTKVIHNTILTNGQYPSAIETRFSNTTGVLVVNNLADRGLNNRDGASSTQQGNVWTAAASWFVNPSQGDLHLQATASGAIDRGVVTSDVTNDWDGASRYTGSAPDVGADERATGTPPVDSTSPSVSVSAPSAGATVSGTVALSATATDNVAVTGVWFTVDGNTVGAEDTSAPYQISWNSSSVANGSRVVRALARDAAGNVATSSPASITVNNVAADNSAPSVWLTAPANNATVSGTVTVSATASDNVGVTSVQFQLNGVNLGSPDTTAPYSLSWNTAGAANGTHTLRAIARDAAGNATTSAIRIVTVNNVSADKTAPTVSLTAPASNATVSGTVTVSASASDNVGVTAVQFQLNGANLGTADTSAPYSISWNTAGAANGSHQLRAIARDAAGNTTTSAARTVVVNNTVATTPPTAPSTPPPSTCTTRQPGANWTCYNGGWLPPGMTPPQSSVVAPPPVVTPPPTTTPPPSVPATCTTRQPGANWTCHNGGWLPPGMVPPPTVQLPASPTAPAAPPPASTTGCSTPAPGAGWGCKNGGWLPPGHPALTN